MITRSSARRERELRRTVTKHSQGVRKKTIASSNLFVSPYNLRSSMGKRAGNSSKGTARRLRNVDLSDIAPTRLFPMDEEESSPVITTIKVCFSFLFLCCYDSFIRATTILNKDM